MSKIGRKYVYPFETLKLGEFFLVKGARCSQLSPYTAYANKNLAPKQFKTKTVATGVMVQRVR